MSIACSIPKATNTLSEHVIITATIYKDSRMTLDSHKNSKIHTFLIEEIRRKLTEMGKINWKIQLCWVKVHVRTQGNELADTLAKEAETNADITECYKKVPKKCNNKCTC
jgi:ribonuclease HI